MNEFCGDNTRYHSQIAEYVFHFGTLRHNQIVIRRHEVEQHLRLDAQVSLAVQDAKQHELVKVIHVLTVFLEELHAQARVQYRRLIFINVKNSLYCVTWHKLA